MYEEDPYYLYGGDFGDYNYYDEMDDPLTWYDFYDDDDFDEEEYGPEI